MRKEIKVLVDVDFKGKYIVKADELTKIEVALLSELLSITDISINTNFLTLKSFKKQFGLISLKLEICAESVEKAVRLANLELNYNLDSLICEYKNVLSQIKNFTPIQINVNPEDGEDGVYFDQEEAEIFAESFNKRQIEMFEFNKLESFEFDNNLSSSEMQLLIELAA